MKKYLKQFGVILVVVLAVLVLLAVFRFVGADSTLTREVKNLWGVELPAGYGIAYRAATDTSLKEGGLRYHVLAYADESMIAQWQEWGDGTQPALYADTALEAAEDILTALGVPGGEWPDTDQVWYTSTDNGSELVVFYDDILTQLYLIESCK